MMVTGNENVIALTEPEANPPPARGIARNSHGRAFAASHHEGTTMKRHACIALAAALTFTPSLAGSHRDIAAQDLVDRFVAGHPEMVSLQLAVSSDRGCRTIAATAREAVGAMCDAAALGPMSSGMPRIALPTRHDPVYEISQALHDARGTVIGAAGMNLSNDVARNRDSALAHARKLLRELEQQIPSKSMLLEPAR
jgi:hypothetical protein